MCVCVFVCVCVCVGGWYEDVSTVKVGCMGKGGEEVIFIIVLSRIQLNVPCDVINYLSESGSSSSCKTQTSHAFCHDPPSHMSNRYFSPSSHSHRMQ